jgi:hypothetical protein
MFGHRSILLLTCALPLSTAAADPPIGCNATPFRRPTIRRSPPVVLQSPRHWRREWPLPCADPGTPAALQASLDNARISEGFLYRRHSNWFESLTALLLDRRLLVVEPLLENAVRDVSQKHDDGDAQPNQRRPKPGERDRREQRQQQNRGDRQHSHDVLILAR